MSVEARSIFESGDEHRFAEFIISILSMNVFCLRRSPHHGTVKVVRVVGVVSLVTIFNFNFF